MKTKTFSYLSTISLALGAVIGGYGVLKTYLDRAALPPGTCPVTNNRPLLSAGIAFLVLSFIFSLIEHYYKKRTE